MKVFISWSGTKSREVAEALSSWIRQLIQATDTWISPEIEKGARWSDEISRRLEESRYGIICLTKENLSSEWILFEAGALSKTKDARVCTFLLDLSPADVKPPLGQFQHTGFDEADMRKLVHSVNKKLGESGGSPLPENVLDDLFNTLWPKLSSRMQEIVNKPIISHIAVRPEREILEEILQLVRSSDGRGDRRFEMFPGMFNTQEGIKNINLFEDTTWTPDQLMKVDRAILTNINEKQGSLAKDDLLKVTKHRPY